MKNRWTVTLANESVKRFQSEIAANSYAEQYEGTVSAPDPTPDEQAGEPRVRESAKQRKARLAAEAEESEQAEVPPQE